MGLFGSTLKPYSVSCYIDKSRGAFFKPNGPVFGEEQYAVVRGVGVEYLGREEITTVLLGALIERALKRTGLLNAEFSLAARYRAGGKVHRNVFDMFFDDINIVHDCCNEHYDVQGGPFNFVISTCNPDKHAALTTISDAIRAEFERIYDEIDRSEFRSISWLKGSLLPQNPDNQPGILETVKSIFRGERCIDGGLPNQRQST